MHMNNIITTTNQSQEKEVILWDEKNLTEPKKNCLLPPTFAPNDTIIETKKKLMQSLCDNIIPTKSGIYKIINKINGKYYIGSAVNLNKRWRKHWWFLKRGNHPNAYLQNSWNKHGIDNFIFEVVEFVDVDKLRIIEQTYLNIRDKHMTYNISDDASCPMLGLKHTPETREKIGKKAVGRIKSEKTCQLLSLLSSGKNNPMYGKKHSPEAIEKMSYASKNQIFTPERRLNQSIGQRETTQYHFINIKTGDEFIGTQFEFKKTISVNPNDILFNKRKHICGWTLYNQEETKHPKQPRLNLSKSKNRPFKYSPEAKAKMARTDRNTYSFYNTHTDQYFTGTREEFNKFTGITRDNICNLILCKICRSKGWALIYPIPRNSRVSS